VPFHGPVRDVAHDLCALVETTWNAQSVGQPNDRAGLHLLFGYSAAFGLMEAILRDVGADDPDAAAAHVRTLVSVVLKSLWAIQPADALERERRRRSQNRRFFEGELRRVDHLRQQVGAPDDAIDRVAITNALAMNDAWFAAQSRELAQQSGDPTATVAVDRCDEATVAKRLGMDAFYALTYRETSDAVHFGHGTMLNRFDLLDDGDRVNVQLRYANAGEADRLLGQALLIYAPFLECSRAELGHGITADRVAMVLFGQPSPPDPSAPGASRTGRDGA
jgi:hypothetical protein